MPTNSDANDLVIMADEFAKEQKFDMAIPLLLQAIELDPSNGSTRGRLAEIYNIIGHYDAAIEQITLALKKRQNDDIIPEEGYMLTLMGSYRKKKDYKMVIKTFDQIIEKNPSFGDILYVLVADAYYELEDFKNMSAILNKGLNLFPNSAMIKANLGVAYHNLGDSNAATKELNEALNNCPDEAIHLIFVGLAHCRVDNSDIGLNLMNKAIQMSPENAPENAMYYHLIATAHQSLGDLNNAVSAIDQAIELSPFEISLKEFKKELESLK